MVKDPVANRQSHQQSVSRVSSLSTSADDRKSPPSPFPLFSRRPILDEVDGGAHAPTHRGSRARTQSPGCAPSCEREFDPRSRPAQGHPPMIMMNVSNHSHAVSQGMPTHVFQVLHNVEE